MTGIAGNGAENGLGDGVAVSVGQGAVVAAGCATQVRREYKQNAGHSEI
jgi:hypothetical protein